VVHTNGSSLCVVVQPDAQGSSGWFL